MAPWPCSESGAVLLHTLADGQLLLELCPAGTAAKTQVASSPSDLLVTCGDVQGCVSVWEASTGSQAGTYQLHEV